MLISQLISDIKKKKSIAVVGLDPNLDKLPKQLRAGKTAAAAVLDFNKRIIDTVKNDCIAIKPQLAYYEALGSQGFFVLEETLKYIRSAGLQVIADGKRGDVGSTSKAYADAFLSQGSTFSSDYLTVNPYMGIDTLVPFTDNCKQFDRGVFVLVKTSNTGSNDFQEALIVLNPQDEEKLSDLNVKVSGSKTLLCNLVGLRVSELAAKYVDKSSYSLVGAVVGATQAKYIKDLRAIMPTSYFLVPGYGVQGGSAKDLTHCFNDDGLGAIVNSSRGILYAYEKANDPENFEKHAKEALKEMNDDLRTLF